MQTNLIYQITQTTTWNESDMSILAFSTVIYPRFYHSYIISFHHHADDDEWLMQEKKYRKKDCRGEYKGKLDSKETKLMIIFL